MKKCVLIIVSILTIAMSVLTMFVSEKRLAAKSLFLANVNALARDETGGGEVPGIPVPGPGLKVGHVALVNQMVEIGI